MSWKANHEGEGAGNERYHRAVDALYALIRAGSTKQKRVPRGMESPHLETIRTGLAGLGITQRDLTALHVIHVTGTKGKGSTCAFAESVLRAGGRRTGLYTSPHLISPRERIKVCGQSITEESFADAFESVAAVAPKEAGFFEVLTLMAFKVFVRCAVEVAIIEVGVGGRTDSTNVIDSPAACAVASIGFDHMDLLGSTLREIAWEKSGIFRRGVPAVIAPGQSRDVNEELESRAAEIGARVVHVTEEEELSPSQKLGLDGDFQRKNAALAVAACKQVLSILPRAGTPPRSTVEGGVDFISRGLEACKWPGRAQRIEASGSLVLFIDGAHTPESAEECSRWFSSRSGAGHHSSPPPATLIFSCKSDRIPSVLFEKLDPSLFSLAIFVQLQPSSQFRSPLEMAAGWSHCPTRSATTVEEALDIARQSQGSSRVLVTGSLYLVGAVLRVLKFPID